MAQSLSKLAVPESTSVNNFTSGTRKGFSARNNSDHRTKERRKFEALEEDPRGKLCAATVTSAPRLASPLYILYVPKEASRGGLAFYAPVRCCSSCRRFDNHSRIPVLPILVAGLTTTFPSTSSSSSSSSPPTLFVGRASAGKFVEEGTREGVDSATRAMQKMRRIERDREARRVLTAHEERGRGGVAQYMGMSGQRTMVGTMKRDEGGKS